MLAELKAKLLSRFQDSRQRNSKQGKWKFDPRYKELLDVSCPQGEFTLMFTWGISTVSLPNKEVWTEVSQDWAKTEWDDLHFNLFQWCARNKIELQVGPYQSVFGEMVDPPVWWPIKD